MRRTGTFILAILVMVTAATGRAEDWPQFRGPNGSGVSTSRGLPTEFSHKDKVAWSATLGDGISCPIVHSGRVYNTAMTDKQEFTVYCHDAASGALHWSKKFATGKLPRVIWPNRPASSTPACDGQRVYLYVSTLGLFALNCADGEKVWNSPLPVPAYLMDWGAASSPILYKDLLIFNQDDDLTPYLIAVDASTGKQRWKTPRPDMLGGYALPVLCEANGRTDVVVAGTGKLKGYDPATGKELWNCNTLIRTIMTSPVVKDGVIFIAVQSYGDAARTLDKALLEWLDTNQDGKLSRNEVPDEFKEKFDASDKTKKGYLTAEDLKMAFQAPDNMAGGGNTIQAVKGGGLGDVTKTHLLWNLTKLKAPSNMASPIVVGNNLYVVKVGGLTSCFDTATGQTRWERQRLRNLGDYLASPVAADGKIFMTSKGGFIAVLAAEPRLKILASNDMNGEVIASPAIADGRIFVRTNEKIICISNEAKSARR